jgi:hypothetical protein
MKGDHMKKRIALLATTCVLVFSSPALAISPSPLRAQPQPSAKSQPVKKSTRSPRIVTASGFNPSVNGFSFANWQSGSLPEETSISLLVQLFGEQSICQTVNADHSCAPFPKAKQFSQQFADTIAFGRCEGMVVLASTMFASGKTASGLSKQEVDSSILYWWASQILPSVTAASESTKQLMPTELLPLIANGISNGSSNTLGLYYRGLGHTLLPIKQIQNGNVVTVDVYDSNTPLVTQHVLINTASNSWNYTAVDASGNTVMNWAGAGAGSLDVIPMSARQPQATSYFAQ